MPACSAIRLTAHRVTRTWRASAPASYASAARPPYIHLSGYDTPRPPRRPTRPINANCTLRAVTLPAVSSCNSRNLPKMAAYMAGHTNIVACMRGGVRPT